MGTKKQQLLHKRIVTQVPDADTDPRGKKRDIPIGTVGTILSYHGGLYDIGWEDGAWTRWSETEIRRDAVFLTDSAPVGTSKE